MTKNEKLVALIDHCIVWSMTPAQAKHLGFKTVEAATEGIFKLRESLGGGTFDPFSSDFCKGDDVVHIKNGVTRPGKVTKISKGFFAIKMSFEGETEYCSHLGFHSQHDLEPTYFLAN